MSRQPPNILFVLTDNQSPDLISCYGENAFPTPAIDRLADQGMLFEKAFCTNGLCSPTRASLLTGLMPSQHGVHCAFDDDVPSMAEDYCAVREFRTLPLTLKNRGYRTAMIGKWHLGRPDEAKIGYEHWIALGYGHTEDFYDSVVFENGRRRSVVDRHIVDYFGDKAVEYLSTVDGERPFYLQMNLNGPYALPPSNAGPDTRNRFYADCARRVYPTFPALDPSMTALIRGPYGKTYNDYASEPAHGKTDTDYPSDPEREESDWVWECLFMHNDQASLANLAAQNAVVDFNVGKVLEALKGQGLDEDTLVVLSTDQSNPFGHHGLWGHPYLTIPSYIRDCTFRIPLVFRHLGVIERGQRNAHVVSQCDLFPTLLDYVGLGEVDIANSPGRSFASMLRGEAAGEWEDVAYLEHEESRAIRTPSYLYVKRLEGVGVDELYDLSLDPEQNENVRERLGYEDAIRDLDARLRAFFEEYSDPRYDIWKGGRPKVTEHRLALFRRLFGQDWSTVADSLPPFTAR